MIGNDDRTPEEDEEDSRLAPEGAQCAQHPERPALAVCPRCGSYACLSCWHQAVDRCEDCLARDPAAAGPPVPWEDPTRGWLGRFFGTLGAAFAPTRTATSFARAEIAPAARFALLTALPLALLSGVIPYTHLLRFGDGFGVEPIGTPVGPDIALDVARAMGFGLLLQLTAFLGLTLPYVSLSKSYGKDRAAAAALRVSLYRAWLLPASGLDGVLGALVAWGVPLSSMGTVEVPGPGFYLLTMAALFPVLLHFVSLRATARLGAGLSPLPSFVAAVLAFVVMGLAFGIVRSLLEPLLPGALVPGA